MFKRIKRSKKELVADVEYWFNEFLRARVAIASMVREAKEKDALIDLATAEATRLYDNHQRAVTNGFRETLACFNDLLVAYRQRDEAAAVATDLADEVETLQDVVNHWREMYSESEAKWSRIADGMRKTIESLHADNSRILKEAQAAAYRHANYRNYIADILKVVDKMTNLLPPK